jgi:hypothetical protein
VQLLLCINTGRQDRIACEEGLLEPGEVRLLSGAQACHGVNEDLIGGYGP